MAQKGIPRLDHDFSAQRGNSTSKQERPKRQRRGFSNARFQKVQGCTVSPPLGQSVYVHLEAGL